MNRLILTFLMAVCVSCEPNLQNSLTKCSKVKVLASMCGSVVLQIQDPSLVGFGEDWSSRPGIGPVYTGCFLSHLDCETMEKYGTQFVPNQNELLVEFIESDNLVGCARCAAIVSNPPTTNYSIKVIANCGQDQPSLEE